MIKNLHTSLKLVAFSVIAFVSTTGVLKAQDIPFSQFYLNPLYLNGAYAGINEVPRLGLQARDQWSDINNAYRTIFLGFDSFIEDWETGYGISLYHDSQFDDIYTESQANFTFAKGFRFNNALWMYGSLSAGLQYSQLRWEKLIFRDGLDATTGSYSGSQETPPDQLYRIVPDFSASVLFIKSIFEWGFSVNHLHEPNEAYYNRSQTVGAVVYRKYTAHFEADIPIHRQGRLKKFFILTPSVILQYQGGFRQIIYGTYINRIGFSLGAWVRQNDLKNNDVIVMAGYIGRQLRTGISYDFNLGTKGLGPVYGTSVELSVSYLLRYPNKTRLFPFSEYRNSEWEQKKRLNIGRRKGGGF